MELLYPIIYLFVYLFLSGEKALESLLGFYWCLYSAEISLFLMASPRKEIQENLPAGTQQQ